MKMGQERTKRSGGQAPDATRMKEVLARLVSFASENPPGREEAVALHLGELMAALGFSVEVPEVAPGRRNVVARLDNGDGPTLAFNSHLDVVPAGAGWSSSPYHLVERDGRLYGRGTCDAKGSITSMIEAMIMLRDSSATWQGRLIGVFVADEEIGGRGSRAFVAGHQPVDRVVIGEPTSLSTITAHKGVLRPRVRVEGTSAHSGMPELGENAILAAGRLIGLFEGEDARLRKICHPLCGNASLSITRIEGGAADNIIPPDCEFVIDRRILPGETCEQVEREIRTVIERAKRDHSIRASIVSFSTAMNGCETPIVDRAVVEAVDTCRCYGVHPSGPLGFMGGCDLVYFVAAGSRGIVLGPGSLDVAHKPDEFVPVNELGTAAMIYRDLMLRLFHSGSWADGEA